MARSRSTGGMNLAWPYIGPPGSDGLWRDLSVVVEGPAVSEIEALFASDWRFTTDRDPTRSSDRSQNPPTVSMESSVIQVVAQRSRRRR